MKTYTVSRHNGKKYKYLAKGHMGDIHPELCGILLDPELPNHFWTKSISERSIIELNKWENYFYATSHFGGYALYCLDGGAHDRPTERGTYKDANEIVIQFRKYFDERKEWYTAYREMLEERDSNTDQV